MGNRQVLVGVSIAFMIFPIIAVALRFWSRWLQKAGIKSDDYMILPALLFSTGMCIAVLIGATMGSEGEHMHLDKEGTRMFVIDLKTEYFLQIQTALASGCTKISLLLLYRRIFRGRAFEITTLIFGVIIVCWMIAFFFKNILQCVPAYLFWAPPAQQKGHCFNAVPSYLAYGITDLVTDIMILSLPVPQVWKLKMPTKRKVAVSGIFLLGLFVVIVGAIRLAEFFVVGHEYSISNDVPFYNPPTEYWDLIETSTGVVCACLPTLRPVFGRRSVESIVGSLRSIRSGVSLHFINRPGSETLDLPQRRRSSDGASENKGSLGEFTNEKAGTETHVTAVQHRHV